MIDGNVVLVSKRKYSVYLISYSIVRFALEYLRGDDRGAHLLSMTPSQIISLIVLTVVLLLKFTYYKKHRSRKSKKTPLRS